jgi:hypothetical protein
VPSPQVKNPMQDVIRLLRGIDRKLDIVIEAQGLEAKLAEREAADRAAASQRRESIGEQFGRTRSR